MQLYQFKYHSKYELGLREFFKHIKKYGKAEHRTAINGGRFIQWFDFNHDWACTELAAVTNYFLSKLPKGEWDTLTWFNLMLPGGGIDRHNHTFADYVGVYFLQGIGGLKIGNYRVPVLPGRLVVFSGDDYHEVPEVKTERISIVLNATIKKKKNEKYKT